MSASSQPRRRKLGLDQIEEMDAAAQDYARKTNAPTSVPSAERAGEGPIVTITRLKPQRSPSRRIHIETPIKAIKQLKERATDEDTTMTYVVLTALKASGIEISDDDMKFYRRAPN